MDCLFRYNFSKIIYYNRQRITFFVNISFPQVKKFLVDLSGRLSYPFNMSFSGANFTLRYTPLEA